MASTSSVSLNPSSLSFNPSSVSLNPGLDLSSTNEFPPLGNSKQPNLLQELPAFFSLIQHGSSGKKISPEDANRLLREKINELGDFSKTLISDSQRIAKVAEQLLTKSSGIDQVDTTEMKRAILKLQTFLLESNKTKQTEKKVSNVSNDTLALNEKFANLLNDLCNIMKEVGESEKADPKNFNSRLKKMKTRSENLTDQLVKLIGPITDKFMILNEKITTLKGSFTPVEHVSSIAKFLSCEEETIQATTDFRTVLYDNFKNEYDELQEYLSGIKIFAQGIEWEQKRLDLTANILFKISDLSAKLRECNGKLDDLKDLIREHPETPEANLLNKCDKIKNKYLKLANERLNLQENLEKEIADLTKMIAENEKELRNYIDSQKLYDDKKASEIKLCLDDVLSNVAKERKAIMNDLQVIWDNVIKMIDNQLFVDINRIHDAIEKKSVAWKWPYKQFSMSNTEELYVKPPIKEKKVETKEE